MRACALAFTAAIALSGCQSKDTAFEQAPIPKYDASAIAQAALADYDKNKDGQLDASELGACPALQSAVNAIDTNSDRRLSAAEIVARVESYAAASTGTVPVSCIVMLDGQSLVDAKVTLVPERCMGSAVKPATGKTDSQGVCGEFTVDGKTYRGVAAGLYRIQVAKDGVSIPARFNDNTALGREVYFDPRLAETMIELNLVSR